MMPCVICLRLQPNIGWGIIALVFILVMRNLILSKKTPKFFLENKPMFVYIFAPILLAPISGRRKH